MIRLKLLNNLTNTQPYQSANTRSSSHQNLSAWWFVFFRASIFGLLLVHFGLKANTDDAHEWLLRMQESSQTLNYEISFVVVNGNKADPWRWFHGTVGDNELEILTALNGPGQQLIRKNQVITYLQPEQPAYSIKDTITDGPIPELVRANIEQISLSYDFHLVGKSRVAGLPARLVRIIAKDNHRYNYWLWLHEDTGLLLKSAIVSENGEALEQLQVSNVQVFSEPSEIITEVDKADLPEAVMIKNSAPMQNMNWQIGWVPPGFEPVKVDRHYLYGTNKELVDYVMLSDGVVWFSIYLRQMESGETVKPVAFNSGANSYLTQQIQQAEVTVIGKIPAETAQRVVNAISWKE
ncbi:anti sigma E (sigma 24) factor, negative regulator [Catenovulum agarivorans DS-2]|uniref:Anti sigma E (Sigma 24) factor, negative regulator n=1 Tax=Catenovulum agarivorans DS-2 TaxID=1328313 RepID=W7QW74_9ALTE|nr:MucB/RseB C-terminal domain-containing protein [Catenovulum agarivorans]EWH12003.1 anti sigma E (sigma 24) factor, negative regulator [Catenovulum agarivorans DS-2]